MQPTQDPYYKRHLTYQFAEYALDFATAALLASAHEIDPAVDVLLNALIPSIQTPPSAILDLGCGYGVLGVTLAKIFPEAQVTLVDKDLIALRYARFNSAANALQNTTILGSVGMRGISDKHFDLIVSDIPSKIGDRAIETDFFTGPLALLNPNGAYWIVADSGLNRLLPSLARKHKLKLHKATKRQGKVVYTLFR